MQALRFFALTFMIVGSALFLSSGAQGIQAKMEDEVVMLVNVYAPKDGTDTYTVETLPVHGAAYVPAASRSMEKISLAILFIVIGYALHVIGERTPLLAIHWKKYLQVRVKRVKAKKPRRR